jgi:hypothetical protein
MPSRVWCCSNPKQHPNDWVCKLFGVRPICAGGGTGVATPSGTGAPGGTQIPVPDWLVNMENALGAIPGGPSIQQIMVLGQALQAESYADDALKVAQYLETQSAGGDFAFMGKVFQLQAESYRALDNPSAANLSLKLAGSMINAAQLRTRLR